MVVEVLHSNILNEVAVNPILVSLPLYHSVETGQHILHLQTQDNLILLVIVHIYAVSGLVHNHAITNRRHKAPIRHDIKFEDRVMVHVLL